MVRSWGSGGSLEKLKMKRYLVLVATLGLAAVALAAGLRAEIESTNKKVREFLLKGDVAGFEKYLKPRVTSDFKYIEEGKTQNFKQMVDEMKVGMSMMKMTKLSTKILEVKESGSTGSSKEEHSMEATQKGPDGKTQTMTMVGKVTNKFRKVNGKWLLAEMNWTYTDMKMNGKPFNPGVPPSGGR